jgi:signal transduction histidine kinase
VIQARAGQVRSLTEQGSQAATFADIATAAGRADEEITRAALTADALRIIQEGLTNTRKHAPGAPVSVTLEVIATGLHIDIINGPARSASLELDSRGGGAGLLGMTERVKAHGGQLSAGPAPGGELAGIRQPALAVVSCLA